MKNYIYLNYGINIDKVYDMGDNFFLDDGNDFFYFVKVDKTEEELVEKNYLVSRYWYKWQPMLIIYNKSKKIISLYNEVNYCLVMVKGLLNETVTFKELQECCLLSINERSNVLKWSERWQKRIDYIKVQLNELGSYGDLGCESADYYIGMAESGIAFLNNAQINYQNCKINLNHYRLSWPIIRNDFYNPINVIIDYRVRDIAEYIKKCFWDGEKYNYLNVKKILIEFKLNYDEIKLLYGRLLYNADYLDIIEDNLINKKKANQNIEKYLVGHEKYEQFLKDFYYDITTMYGNDLPKIDWLLITKS